MKDNFVEQLRSLFEIIKTLIENKFYGNFTIKFEAGKIVKCDKNESIKL